MFFLLAVHHTPITGIVLKDKYVADIVNVPDDLRPGSPIFHSELLMQLHFVQGSIIIDGIIVAHHAIIEA